VGNEGEFGWFDFDLENSLWGNNRGADGPFSESTGGAVRIEATAANDPSWGSIKKLFR